MKEEVLGRYIEVASDGCLSSVTLERAGWQTLLKVWRATWYPLMHSLDYMVKAYKLMRQRLCKGGPLPNRMEHLVKLWVECWYIIRQAIEYGACWHRGAVVWVLHLVLETAKSYAVLIQDIP